MAARSTPKKARPMKKVATPRATAFSGAPGTSAMKYCAKESEYIARVILVTM